MAQETAPAQPSAEQDEPRPQLQTTRPAPTGRWRSADEITDPAKGPQASAAGPFTVATGTRIPLGLINSISTRSAAPGDRVYLETVFPIVVDGKVVIPPGSYVLGTVTSSTRPGRVKGKGELYLRFDSLTLPNGVTRDFRARVGGLDGGLREGLERDEGAIKGDSDKGSDAMTVAGTTVTGGSLGTLGGLAAGNAGRGAGVGLAAGAAAGLATVLLTRGPDVVLPAGSTLELVTDRPLEFSDTELQFEGAGSRSIIRTNTAPTVNQQRPGIGTTRQGFPPF
ncbi:MAG: hypothetical protein KIT83_16810 [Bryobacterales bacterium]|nr:hypothetical protein [Bryobacterales bacterium]